MENDQLSWARDESSETVAAICTDVESPDLVVLPDLDDSTVQGSVRQYLRAVSPCADSS